MEVSSTNKIAAQWAAILIKDGYQHLFTVAGRINVTKFRHNNGNIATITCAGRDVVMRVNGQEKVRVSL